MSATASKTLRSCRATLNLLVKLKTLYQSNSHVLSANVARIPDKSKQISCMPKALELKFRSCDHNLRKEIKILI